jgi:hypothetical protein
MSKEKATMKISFSQWENYQECPRRWKHRYLDKLPTTPAGPAAQRGIAVHAEVETFLQTKGKTPVQTKIEHLDVLEDIIKREKGEIHTEYKMHFDEAWNRTHKDSENVAWVGVFDAVHVTPKRVEVFEWKTGKPKATHSDQRNIYTLMAFRTWGPEEVTATTFYLDGTEGPCKLSATKKSVNILINKWDNRRYNMINDTFWPPRPGFYCRWCDFAKSKGGPCEFGN